MTAKKYIDLAKNHFNIKNEEYIRCAISRYYYGLLHFSIEKLLALNPDEYDNLKTNLTELPYQGYSIHSATIEAVKKINPILSNDIDIVRKLRVLSDYNFNESVLSTVNVKIDAKKQINKTFTNTEEILNFLEDVSSKINELKGVPKDKSPKISADMTGLATIKQRMLEKK